MAITLYTLPDCAQCDRLRSPCEPVRRGWRSGPWVPQQRPAGPWVQQERGAIRLGRRPAMTPAGVDRPRIRRPTGLRTRRATGPPSATPRWPEAPTVGVAWGPLLGFGERGQGRGWGGLCRVETWPVERNGHLWRRRNLNPRHAADLDRPCDFPVGSPSGTMEQLSARAGLSACCANTTLPTGSAMSGARAPGRCRSPTTEGCVGR